MTISYAPTGGDLYGKVNATANGPVVTGELVTLLESGRVVRSSTALGISKENSLTNGPAQLASSMFDTSVDRTFLTNPELNIGVLSDGNVVYGFPGNGTLNTTNVNFRIKTTLGATVSSNNSVSIDTGVNSVKILPLLLSNSFVIFWLNNNVIKFAIYDNQGILLKSATTVATIETASTSYYSVTALNTGEFVVCYSKVTNGGANFQRFNALGLLQGAEVVIDAAIASQNYASIACANGDFLVTYFKTTVTQSQKYARYTNLGVLVGAVITLGTISTALNQTCGFHQSIVELSNGNIVIMAPGPIATGSGKPYAYLYSAAGVFITAIGNTILANSVEQYASSGTFAPVIALSDGFAIVSSVISFHSSILRTFDNNGVARAGPVSLAAISSGFDSLVNLSLHDSGNSITTVVSCSTAATTNHYMRIFTVDLNLELKGSVVIIDLDNPEIKVLASSIVLPNKTVVFTYKHTTFSSFRAYRVTRSSVLGIALNSASEGGTVNVATKGSFTLPASQSFSNGGQFDSRTAVVPGTKGFVSGRAVTLLGMT